MNKKILSLVLGSAMLTASAIGFAGCGHKHNFEIYYELADCDSAGFTLHTCTDCGYQYADEFVEPYGHALRTYYHIEEVGSAKAVKYSLTADGSGSHYSMFTSFSQEDLDKLKEFGDKIIFHKDVNCGHCDHGKQGGGGKGYDEIIDDAKKVETNVDDYDKSVTINIPSVTTDGSGNAVPKTIISKGEFDSEISKVKGRFELIIPDSVAGIENNAFTNCEKLDRVKLSNNILAIGENAFKGAKLPYVVIPKSVRVIGANAFGDYSNMQAIYYCGTKDEWNKIIFESELEGKRDAIRDVTVYFYTDLPRDGGDYWHYNSHGEVQRFVKIYYVNRRM